MFQLDGYRVEKYLCTGYRDAVYAATRQDDGLEVILKCSLAVSPPEESSPLEREFAALCQTQGPGVVRVVELSRAADVPVLVLERLPGQSLRALLEHESLSLANFFRVAEQLVDALARIHAARIIHRGVRPGNVLVEPGTLETHLIGFGRACALGSAQRPAEMSLGGRPERALQYMAPEQSGRMGRGVDLRSDLYSLGATLYAALTGRPPFESSDPLELIHAHIARVPPALDELRREIPALLCRIVMKLLQKGAAGTLSECGRPRGRSAPQSGRLAFWTFGRRRVPPGECGSSRARGLSCQALWKGCPGRGAAFCVLSRGEWRAAARAASRSCGGWEVGPCRDSAGADQQERWVLCRGQVRCVPSGPTLRGISRRAHRLVRSALDREPGAIRPLRRRASDRAR